MQKHGMLVHTSLHFLEEVIQPFNKPPQLVGSFRIHLWVHNLPDFLHSVRNHIDKAKRPREHAEQVRYVFGEFYQKLWLLVSHGEGDGVKMPKGSECQTVMGVWKNQAAIPD